MKTMKILHFFLSVSIAVLLLSSCASTKKISYFQDILLEENAQKVTTPHDITIRPEDKISILVNSRDPLLSELFNLPIISRQVGVSSRSYDTSNGLSGYTVDPQGQIDFPVLGKITVAGKSRAEIADYIKQELITKDQLKDPVVTVEYMNLSISVLGEVNDPGKYDIVRDRITLLDALGMAGDLTIYGKRDNILILREVHGEQQVYKVDIRSAKEMYSSPGYYLQQNDVVYVEPNPTRARQSTINGNNVPSASFWITVASLLATITVIFVK